MFDNLTTYTRFAMKLPGFLRRTINFEQALAAVQKRMQEREANFLRFVQKGIFGYPRSPYLPLLQLAGCELGDIEESVRRRGIEETLYALRSAGVFISFEEFKGREPIVRNGRVISVKEQDFDNPYLSSYYRSASGGSTGAGTRVAIDLDHLADGAPHILLAYHAHGVLGLPTAMWRGVLPDDTGIRSMLRAAHFGHIYEKWFSPFSDHEVGAPFKYRLATQYIVGMGRLAGVRLPQPERVDLADAQVIARWAAAAVAERGACLILCNVSMAVRICVAAREKGIDLTGAAFFGGGEPPSPAKVQRIVETGARWIPIYVTTETGHIGVGCVQPVDGTDTHLLQDAVALIQYPRRVPGFDLTVQSFHFTGLLPSMPKVMLNVESDDYGIRENRSCGCPLEGYGFVEHLRDIHSFRKLTGEGVTLVGSEFLRILEEVLPARFGGSPIDYQLVEEEDGNGFTRLSLLVNPKIEIADEHTVVETVLEELGKGSVSANLAKTIWSQAKTLSVKRQEPIWSDRGKLMPLRQIQAKASRPRRSSEADVLDNSGGIE